MYSYLEYPHYVKNTIEYNYPQLDLFEGQWIWCEHFKEANKIKKLYNGLVIFEYKYSNGLDCGNRKFVENRDGKEYAYHRNATVNEINVRLNQEN